jgi:hypothetical protein
MLLLHSMPANLLVRLHHFLPPPQLEQQLHYLLQRFEAPANSKTLAPKIDGMSSCLLSAA